MLIYYTSTVCLITQHLLNDRNFLGIEQNQKMEFDPSKKFLDTQAQERSSGGKSPSFPCTSWFGAYTPAMLVTSEGFQVHFEIGSTYSNTHGPCVLVIVSINNL